MTFITSPSTARRQNTMVVVKTAWLLMTAIGLVCNVSNAIPILGGRFETTTDVQKYLNLALDAANMKETDDLLTKRDIYSNGVVRNNEGGSADVTLQQLSLDAKTDMGHSPIYNIFRHAFLVLGNAEEGETEGLFDGSPVSQYGDTLVDDLFDLKLDDIETEAAVVMNVWGAVVFELFETLTECGGQNYPQGLAALDRAIAMWVGEDQLEGSSDGHLLYSLTEAVGERFDQDDGETEINTKIIDLFTTMQLMLVTNKCEDTAGYVEMRGHVKRMVAFMSVPLLQNLIHHIMNVQNEGGSNYVELYALATIPRVAACDPAAYDDELHLDVLRELTLNLQQPAIDAIQRALSCFDVTCADVGDYMSGVVPACTDPTDVTAAGYSTSRDGARAASRLDRDLLQMDIFMKFNAYGTALDWYTHGWNSDYSFQQLARNEVFASNSDSLYTTYKDYWGGEEHFAHNYISNVMERTPPFTSASDSQIRNLVTGTLKYTTMFTSAIAALESAIAECRDTNTASALDFWDTGVMFFIGSMEGQGPNGNQFGGEFLFTTAKELCGEFSTCTGTVGADSVQNAAANEAVMTGLKNAISSFDGASCDAVESILNDQILPNMVMPLIQGTIKYASFNGGLNAGTGDASLAIGAAFARATLPIVNDALPASASTIRDEMDFQLSSKPVENGFGAVAGAFRDALPSMSTACDDIGIFEDVPDEANLCSDQPVVAPPTPTTAPIALPPIEPGPPTAPADIAFGRYTFSSLDVADGDGSFALDVRDMHTAESIPDAQDVYQNGVNAQTVGLSGDVGIISLASLSAQAAQYMTEDPMFNIYKYALYDDEDLDDSNGQDFLYDDDVVEQALTHGKDTLLAAEGAVVMNVWMFIVHRLYSAVRQCRQQQSVESLIDSAVALWIGKEQQEGKFLKGWMMYSIGQSTSMFFGFDEAEAPVNTEIMNLFNEAQSIAATCQDQDSAFIRLRETVSGIIRNLSKVLILALLYHMVRPSKNMVELYAVAVVPQASACDDDVGDALVNALFSGYHHQTSLTDDLTANMAAFLRCQRITCEDLAYRSGADKGLQTFVNNLCLRLDFYKDTGDNIPMAGYIPKQDVYETARLDLDIKEIKIMTRTEAYDAAKDIYELGHNSISRDGTWQSLRDLATSANRDSILQFQLFTDYFSSRNYADDIIIETLGLTGKYGSATRGQISEVVVRTLQGMVTYMGVLTEMQTAVKHCNNNEMRGAAFAWDKAAALYIGSAQGLASGGRPAGIGTTLYALANEVCNDFNTCEPNGEAQVNENIIIQFSGGRDSLSEGSCNHIERTMTWEILPRMAIPLIQASISYSEDNEDISIDNPDSLATAELLAKSVTPLVKKANEDSATALDQFYNEYVVGRAVDPLYDAYANAVRGMKIDCATLGTSEEHPELSLCPDDSDNEEDAVAPLPDSPTNLGNDLYVTTTYVDDKADIAKDIADMTDLLNARSFEQAQLVYKDGRNSQKYDENGKFVSVRSLKEFSVVDTLEMADEPLFNIFMYGLQDDSGNFMSRQARLYADTLVEDAFATAQTTGPTVLPAEAALVLNLWMNVAHLLYKTLTLCKAKILRDEDGVHSMDVAVAYWIGDGQIAGDGQNGHLLYALAENMGDLFNMDDGGQARSNTNILRLFNEAKNEISLPGACSESPATFIRLRRIVDNLISQMTVPLIQGLIHNLRANDRQRVQLYAHAVVPMTAACSPSSYDYLKKKLLNDYNVVDVEDIIGTLRSVYPCLGLQCDDVGVHTSEQTTGAPTCQDLDIFHSLAGYRPASDVREYARLDLDLRQLDVLTQMNAYHAAEDLYMYGKNVKGSNGGSLSLSELAMTSERAVVPDFDAFKRYYQSDTYADDIVRLALTGGGDWSEVQRNAVILKTCQVMIMYFGVMQQFYDAVSDCQSTASLRSAGTSDSWDKGAAMLIGHLEGPQTNGTMEGYMYFDLAQEHCSEFGTCADQNSAVAVNEQIISLLYTGRGAVLGNSCSALRKAADEISSLLLVPIIQGALSSSIALSSGEFPATSLPRAEAYVYSRALLPLIDGVNRDAASTIDEYLGVPGPIGLTETDTKVFAAFAKVYPSLDVDCDLVGESAGRDACTGVVYKSGLKLGWVIVLTTVSICLPFACLAMFLSRRAHQRLPENNPKFVTSEVGELNHSMDLLEKAFSNNTKPRTSPSSETIALTSDMISDDQKHNEDYDDDDDDDDDDEEYDDDDDDFDEAQALNSKKESPGDII